MGSIVVSVFLGDGEAAVMGRTARVRIHASASGPAVLWEAERVPAFVDGPDRVRVVLTPDPSTVPALFRRTLRFVSVWCPQRRSWSSRAPIDGTPLVQHHRLEALSGRLTAVESSWQDARIADVLVALREALDDHERRLQALEALAPVRALEARADDLTSRLDRLDQDDGRLVRIEDELEDLVGPQGDVVDFEARLVRLERALVRMSTTSQDPAPS